MAWQEVETDIGGTAGRCKYSVSMKHGGARISVPKSLVELLLWTKDTRFKLLVGGGDAEGKLRLNPTPSGKITTRPNLKGGGVLVRLGRWPTLVARDVDAVAVEYEIDGSALNIILPTHARAVSPAPRPAPTAAHSGGIGRTDVTTKIAGRDGNGGRPISRAPGT